MDKIQKGASSVFSLALAVLAGIYQEKLGFLAWVLLLISGTILLITWGVVRRVRRAWREFWTEAPTKAAATDDTAEEQQITEKPPRVEIVGCERSSGQLEALVIANSGEPAYNIEIPPIQIGGAKLEIIRGVDRLTKEDGRKRVEFEIDGTSERLYMVMRHQKANPIEVVILYQDWNLGEWWYEERCRVERELLASDGLAFTRLGQKRIKRPQR